MDDKPVCLQPTAEQKLRIQLAYRNWELNFETRSRLEAERRFFQLAYDVAQATLPRIDEQLAQRERESRELAVALVNLGEAVKLENCWGDQVRWDASTLTFTAPAEAVPTSATVQSTESKVSIQ